jgi:hypothetical protein
MNRRRLEMKKRLPLVLSITALAVAVLGSTPAGHAVVSAVPPFAKKAHYADKAGSASAVNGIKAARKPKPRFLVPLNGRGKLPASVLAAGPAGPQGKTGPQGAKGDTGPPGLSGYEFVSKATAFDSTDKKSVIATCPAGKRIVGGGTDGATGLNLPVAVRQSFPFQGAITGWLGSAYETTPTSESWSVFVFAICAEVTS